MRAPIPKTGLYEIRFPDGRPSRFIYWDGPRFSPAEQWMLIRNIPRKCLA